MRLQIQSVAIALIPTCITGTDTVSRDTHIGKRTCEVDPLLGKRQDKSP